MFNNKSLLSGSTSMLVLQLLSQKDMYGYEIIEALRCGSNDLFDLKTGTLYPLLHSLEEKNYLSSYEVNDGTKSRKYYTLTSKGKKLLEENRHSWFAYAEAIQNILKGGVQNNG